MEAELHFEREGIDGIAVVGSYLIDAARRLGVTVGGECGRLGLCDSCAVIVKSGAEFLSVPTRAEIDTLKDERLEKGERLACQVKIAAVGSIGIETIEPKDPRTEKQRLVDDFRRYFEELTLEQKIAQLLEFEAVALNDTLSFVMNSPYKAGGKVVDFLSRFGYDKRGERTEESDEAAVDEPAPESSDEPVDSTEETPGDERKP